MLYLGKSSRFSLRFPLLDHERRRIFSTTPSPFLFPFSSIIGKELVGNFFFIPTIGDIDDTVGAFFFPSLMGAITNACASFSWAPFRAPFFFSSFRASGFRISESKIRAFFPFF